MWSNPTSRTRTQPPRKSQVQLMSCGCGVPPPVLPHRAIEMAHPHRARHAGRRERWPARTELLQVRLSAQEVDALDRITRRQGTTRSHLSEYVKAGARGAR